MVYRGEEVIHPLLAYITPTPLGAALVGGVHPLGWDGTVVPIEYGVVVEGGGGVVLPM